jgi:hypothetical protein
MSYIYLVYIEYWSKIEISDGDNKILFYNLLLLILLLI